MTTQNEIWDPLSKAQRAALRRAAAHCDGMTLVGVKDERVLVKRGLVESYGQGRVCISEAGLAAVLPELGPEDDMTDYAKHIITTSQTESARADQVQNNAGGFVFTLDIWARLDRFLILGCDGGSYYASERKMTRENAQVIDECLALDGRRTVDRIVAISEAGRAPKNDPAIFALAMAAGVGTSAPNVRAYALAALPRVARIGTHLFHFVRDVESFRRWGRSLRRAVGAWYTEKSADDMSYQMVKYQSRDGWSHRDVLRLAHPKAPTPQHDAAFRWATGGLEGMAEEVRRSAPTGMTPIARRSGLKRSGTPATYPAINPFNVPALIGVYETVKALAPGSSDKVTLLRLITDHHLTHEMVPNEWKNDPDVWAALLGHMPLGAMVRNLAKMTDVGLLSPMSEASRHVVDALAGPGAVDAIHKARLHPIALLSALKVYQQGHGERGKLSWSPVGEVVDALDAAFYASFQAVEPTGKNTLLALDVSGSMDDSTIAGVPGLTARVASAAMAMVTARTEAAGSWSAVGFTSGAPGEWSTGGGVARAAWERNDGLTPLVISPRQRLDDVIKTVEALPMGGTDCALPMLYAKAKGLEVDTFVVYTDNETWAGNVHPYQALKDYRQASGRPAKLIVVGMTATGFTIADPRDAGMLDLVGFDTAAPAVMADFARG